MTYQFHTTPSLHIGQGLSAKLGELAGGKLGPRVLVITDSGLLELGLVGPALDALKQAGAAVEVFSGVEPDPTLGVLMDAVSLGA